MKNQWLMLIKYEDGFNFVRDLPFILTRELTIAFHHLLFAPRSLAAMPMTLKLVSADSAQATRREAQPGDESA